MLESGVNYDFDASGKPSFSDENLKQESISWARWHANIDQSVAAKQYEFLLSRWRSRGPAFVVIDYTVSDDRRIQACILKSSDPEFQSKFKEAQAEYQMSDATIRAFSKTNAQFDLLTMKAYKLMDGDPVLKFPDGSHRKMVRDVRWHINSAEIKRSVKSRIDDVETLNH